MKTPTQVFSCEFGKIFEETFFKKDLRETASVVSLLETFLLSSEVGKNGFSDYYIFLKHFCGIFLTLHSSAKNS